ncbi:MAG: hypothetical protein AB7K04_07595, partial [Pseudorhodoplanes sp.]
MGTTAIAFGSREECPIPAESRRQLTKATPHLHGLGLQKKQVACVFVTTPGVLRLGFSYVSNPSIFAGFGALRA